jgi:Uma2 family endonuclease
MGMPVPLDPTLREWTPDRVWDELARPDRHWPRYELVDGELLVSPGPRPDHQRVVMELLRLLDPYVAHSGVGELFTSPADIRLTPRDLLQPDVFVLPRGMDAGAKEWREVTGLLLAVEVLSPSTQRHDRVTKRAYLARHGVPDFWIADLGARTIERNGPDARVTVHAERLAWPPAGAGEPLALDVAALYARAIGTATEAAADD